MASNTGVNSVYSASRYINDKSLYVVDLEKAKIESVKAGEFVTGLAAGSQTGEFYVASFEGGKTNLNFGLYTTSTTGISSVKADKAGEVKIYNLQGQRLSAPQKGQICIVNGKKVKF